jgi:hypothetical protein
MAHARGPILRVTAVFAAVLAGAAQHGGSATAQSAQSAPAGAITGVVVDGVSGTPIAGALVILTGTTVASAATQPSPDASVIRMSTNAAGQVVSMTSPAPEPFRPISQLTDSQGRFIFTGLPGHMSYGLRASKFGYVDGEFGRRVSESSTRSAGRRITLGDGQWFRDARFEMFRPSAISGRVIDEAGEPLVGVRVRAYTEIHVAGARQLASTSGAFTDDRGAYRMAGLPPGRYTVAVPSVQHAVPVGLSDLELSGTTQDAVGAAEAAGRASPLRRDPAFAIDPAHRLVLTANSPPPPSASGRAQVYPVTYFPAAHTITEATSIVLAPGEDRPAVDIQLRPTSGFRIFGRLDGPPDAISGIGLRLMGAGVESLGQGTESATALTAADGSFTFLNVPDGAYTIIASRSVTEYNVWSATSLMVDGPSAPGVRNISMSSTAVESGPAGTMLTRHSAEGDGRYYGRHTVAVNGRDETGVVVPMRAAISISGRIVIESAAEAGSTTLSTGRSRVLDIYAEPANGDSVLGMPRANRRPTPQAPEFRIDGLVGGPYLLRIGGSGAIKSIAWNGKDYTHTPFDGAVDHDITGVVITLTNETTTVTGTILDGSGGPVANTAVIAFPAERGQWTNFGIRPIRIRASPGSTTGTYTLVGLPAGEYLLVALTDDQVDRRSDPAFLEGAARGATRVSLSWGETKTQPLTIREIK